MATVVDAVVVDPTAAGELYGNLAGTDKFAIPVKFSGTVTAVEGDLITVTFPGLAAGNTIQVVTGAVINGTAVRDVMGTIQFSDFENQTDYQQVANEYKAIAIAAATASIDSASLVGQEISVIGIYVTNTGPDGTFLVTPVDIEGGKR